MAIPNPKKEEESKPVDAEKAVETKSVEPAPTPPVEPAKPDPKSSRVAPKKQEIVFNPFYKNAGIPHCPVCGESKRTGMDGKQICTQPEKPEGCWVEN